MSFISHSVTATASKSKSSSKDGTYLRRLLSFFIVFHRFSSDLPQFSKHFLLFYIIKLQATILFSDRSSIRRLFGFPNTAARHRRRRATCRQRNTSRPKQLFGQVLQPMDPLLWRTGRRCGDMRILLHKCILRIKGHGTVLAAIGAIRKHQARLCRVPQLRI